MNQTLARKSDYFLLNSFKKLLTFDGGKAMAFRAAPRWKELFLRRVEGRAAEVVRNYLYTGSKVEPAGCGELFSCRVEGRAPEPENYRSTLSLIRESTLKKEATFWTKSLRNPRILTKFSWNFELGAVQSFVESFGFHFFAAGGPKLQRNRGMRQIRIRKRTFFTCSVHKFFKNS